MILFLTSLLADLSASAEFLDVDLAQQALERPVVEADDVLEHEHEVADLLAERRIACSSTPSMIAFSSDGATRLSTSATAAGPPDVVSPCAGADPSP